MTGESLLYSPPLAQAIVTLVGILVVLYFLKLYLAGGVCKSKALLKGKTVLITGANRGIGKETAVELSRRGARVILADVQGGEETARDVRIRSGNENVVFHRLDLASLASVRQFAATVLEEEPRIDILINNAGVLTWSRKTTKDGFEISFGVNHLGHFLLTNLILDRLKESTSARIVIVSSHFYRPGSIFFDDLNLEGSYLLRGTRAYSQSKLANILFTRALAKRLAMEGSRVTVNAVNPGNTRSLLPANAFPSVFLWALFRVIQLFFKTPWQGAQTSIYCAVSEEMEGVTGQYVSDCKMQRVRHSQVTDENDERLWQVSATMVGL